LLFLGFVTFERAIQTAIENMVHSRGINRIRHFYLELAPEMRRYFIHSANDDVEGALHNMGIVPSNSEWQHFVTNAGTVAVINSVLAGVFAGMVSSFVASGSLYLCGGFGVAVFAVSVLMHRRYQTNKYTEFEKRLETQFPGGAKPETYPNGKDACGASSGSSHRTSSPTSISPPSRTWAQTPPRQAGRRARCRPGQVSSI
jgi:hypothetical protein